MAGASDNPSRRDVLGAAVALPFLPLDGGGQVGVAVGLGAGSEAHRSAPESTPTLPSPIKGEDSSSEWQRALSAYRDAEAAVEEAGRVCGAASPAEIGAAEDAFGDRLEELYDALRRLLVVPAPDIGALLVKVELAFEHEIGTLCETAPCIAVIREDVRRLRGQSI